MADLPLESVDIFDDFEDADIMQKAFCKQVLEEQYQEDMRSETDKALGELCMYLDRNPEVYSRVLRKRKQEEMESSGVISFVKSKVMSLLHGEQYPHCLVSASECVEKTSALKTGMCKTFHLSQELNGGNKRHSARLAAKRQGKISKDNSDCGEASKENQAPSKLNAKTIGSRKHELLESSDTESEVSQSAPILAFNGNSEMASEKINHEQNCRGEGSTVGIEKIQGGNSFSDVTTSPAQIEVSSSVTVPSPPPAPPLPTHLFNTLLPKNSKKGSIINNIQIQPQTNGIVRNIISSSPNSPSHMGGSSHRQEHRRSPRLQTSKVTFGKMPSRANSLQNLSTLSDLSNTSSPFLTPDLPLRHKSRKLSQSNSSLSSGSSYGSFTSIHSEILSVNPLNRLKATRVIRSPGGTPARQSSDTQSSGSVHNDLFTALKTRFQKVYTPSPRLSSSNSSDLPPCNLNIPIIAPPSTQAAL